MYIIQDVCRELTGKDLTERETVEIFYELDEYTISMARMHYINDTGVREEISSELRRNPQIFN